MPRIDIDAIEDEWDDEPEFVPRSRNLSPAARRRIDELAIARVVAIDRGRVSIVLDETSDVQPIDATLAGTMRHEKAAVGDRVRVRPARHTSDAPRIVEVLDRETRLVRTADDGLDDARVVVANADQVVVVIAADHLQSGAGLLDRVMVAASAGGLASAVCVNKIDLVDDRSMVIELLDRYAQLGVAGVATSATTGEGIEALRALLTTQWSAFTGHSGVGKSSLFNLLVPEAFHTVADVGRYGGRHTTVASRAMRVADENAWLIDTPGVRSFGLGVVHPEELQQHFPELVGLPCSLDDCVHDGEPGCALDDAAVYPERLVSYRRLLAALRGDDV
ncbi:MAG: ribosome small subunit-dependent GTPase A [Nitriliruptoraceae bacterium]